MKNEQQKGEQELKVFREFVTLSQLPIDITTVEKRDPPEPDILCSYQSEGKITFELVELGDENLARMPSDLAKSGQEVGFCWTSDPSKPVLKKKIGKTRKSYSTMLPIELLAYTGGLWMF